MAGHSARLLGAERVIVIDRYRERLALAFPMAVVTNKSLTIRSAQQHGQRYVRRIFDYIQPGDHPSYLITHDLPLEDAVHGYDLFKNKREGCVRAIFRP